MSELIKKEIRKHEEKIVEEIKQDKLGREGSLEKYKKDNYKWKRGK